MQYHLVIRTVDIEQTNALCEHVPAIELEFVV